MTPVGPLFPMPHGDVLLLDHPDLDLGLHVGVQADRYAVDAEGANRVVKVDQALLDVQALRLELLRDVRSGHGAEQLALLADAGREGEGDLLELGSQLLGGAAALVLGLLEASTVLLDALLVALGGDERQAAGE